MLEYFKKKFLLLVPMEFVLLVLKWSEHDETTDSRNYPEQNVPRWSFSIPSLRLVNWFFFLFSIFLSLLFGLWRVWSNTYNRYNRGPTDVWHYSFPFPLCIVCIPMLRQPTYRSGHLLQYCPCSPRPNTCPYHPPLPALLSPPPSHSIAAH